MTVAEELEALFARELSPEVLEVRDDSARHAGHAGASGGSHFQVTIVSARFEGCSRLERHRRVYDLVGDRMKTTIHALALDLKTPAENTRTRRTPI